MNTRTTIRAAALAVAATALLAGCGNSGTSASAGTKTSSGNGMPVSQIKVVSSSLGKIIVDGNGRTLYFYSPDSPGKSVCEGACLAHWPPADGKPSGGTGVNAGKIGTITRSDGTTQASYANLPLYYYTGDSGSGQTTGQGFDGKWNVVDPTGKPVPAAASSSSSTSSGGGGGYSY
jgi:predicted lipoprotein with Yx(FWY)xxD motif